MSITHRDHFVNIARRRAAEANELVLKNKKEEQLFVGDKEQINGHIHERETQDSSFSSNCKGGFFADQFENLANYRAHYEGTGPEIWEQTGGCIDAFIAAAGTGGTVAGVSNFLQVNTLHSLSSQTVARQLYRLSYTCSTGEESKCEVFPHRSSWLWPVQQGD